VATKSSRKKIRRDASIVRSLDTSLLNALIFRRKSQRTSQRNQASVGTKGVSQNHLVSFDDNKVLKIINWIC